MDEIAFHNNRNPEVFAWLLEHTKKNELHCVDKYDNSEKFG